MRGKVAKKLRQEVYKGIKSEGVRYKFNNLDKTGGISSIGLRFKYQFLKKNWKIYRQKVGSRGI